MKKFLQWLGGADPEVLDRAPAASNAAAGLGGTVLVTSVMASAAFTMATHDWLHVPTVLAAIVGIGWGLAIMNLDRWLLMATHRQSSGWHTAALAVPRVLLALVVGFVIAEPLVLRVFENEVTIQAKDDRQTEKEGRQKNLKAEYADIPRMESQQAKLQQTIAAGPAVVFAGNPDYEAAKVAYDRTQNQLANAQKAVGCEAEGTCGTGKAGCGPVCAANQRIASQRQRAADKAESALNGVIDRLRRSSANSAAQTKQFATPELARVDKDLATRRAEYDSKLASIEKDYRTPIGLIDRKVALEHLTQKNAVVGWTTWLFRLFLLAVDITPILFKTLLLVGRPTPYERAQEEIEEREHTRLKAAEDAEDEAHGIQLKLVAEEAEIQAEHRRKALKEMHEKIAETEKEVWLQQIEDWRDAVRASHAASGNGGRPAGGGRGSGGVGALPAAGTNRATVAGQGSGGRPQRSGRFQRGGANGSAASSNGVTPATANASAPSWLSHLAARLRTLAGALRRPTPHAPVGP